MADYILVHGGKRSAENWNKLTKKYDYPPGDYSGSKSWDETVGKLPDFSKEYKHEVFVPILKEIRETQYCLNLLKDSGYISERLHGSLLPDCIELAKLINRIIFLTLVLALATTKTNLKKIK